MAERDAAPAGVASRHALGRPGSASPPQRAASACWGEEAREAGGESLPEPGGGIGAGRGCSKVSRAESDVSPRLKTPQNEHADCASSPRVERRKAWCCLLAAVTRQRQAA